MRNKLTKQGFIFVLSVIAFGAIMRLLPHWPNFTPITAIALFGGVYLNKKFLPFIIPLAALFLSDLVLGLHSFMIPVYLTFVLIVLFSRRLPGNIKPGTIAGASLVSSFGFYLITNLFVWLTAGMYPVNAAGLVSCYVAGLPFLFNGVMGDLFYSGLFFGAFYMAQVRFPVLKPVQN
ncbi:MAG: hypothetical protein JXA03_12590 [Bacteroidales bacterium]|nr:hypothetical protein [Bacteroidales bacterium]